MISKKLANKTVFLLSLMLYFFFSPSAKVVFGQSVENSRANQIFAVGLTVGFAEYGAMKGDKPSFLALKLKYAIENAEATGCVPTQRLKEIRQKMLNTSNSRSLYREIESFRRDELAFDIMKYCGCTIYQSPASTDSGTTGGNNTTSTNTGSNSGQIINWSVSPKSLQLRGKNGQVFCFQCESNNSGNKSIWGTDEYTDDSSICTAAKHAGLISNSGGSVCIKITPGLSKYTGTNRNGFKSGSWGSYSGSFVFSDAGSSTTVGATTVQLNLNKYVFSENEDITVLFSGMLGSSSDWIALTKKSSPISTYDTYKYTNSLKSGSLTFPGLKAGDYEARAYFSNNYDLKARIAFTVVSGGNEPSSNDISNWKVDKGPYQINGTQIDAQPAGDGKTSYYIAPNEFKGDWSGYSMLRFDKKSSGGSYYGPDSYGAKGDVIVKNGSQTARYDIAKHHNGNWKTFSVPLNGKGWTLSGGATLLGDVLRNVTEFRIRAEYGTGTDKSSLRNVTVVSGGGGNTIILPPDNPFEQLPPPSVNINNWKVDYGPYDINGAQIDAKPAGDGKTSYYISPNEFKGDWRGYSSLHFDKKSSGGSYYGPDSYGAKGDVIVKNGSQTARYDIAKHHNGNWKTFSVPLNGNGWTLSGGATLLGDVLRNVTEFRIRAEYGAGTDKSSLRNVYLFDAR